MAATARKLRVLFEGAIYHVTVRGVEHRRLFRDDADRERFVTRLGDAADEYGVRVYLFVCMHNHVHLLCETPKANLSAFMHKLQTAYTVYHNFEEAVLRRRCYGCKARAVAALLLGRHAGMNRRDVGVFLGMGTGSAVCRQLRDLWERMTSDRSPGEIVSRAESAMQQTASQSHEP